MSISEPQNRPHPAARSPPGTNNPRDAELNHLVSNQVVRLLAAVPGQYATKDANCPIAGDASSFYCVVI